MNRNLIEDTSHLTEQAQMAEPLCDEMGKIATKTIQVTLVS